MQEEARLAPTVREYVPVGQFVHTERPADKLYAPLAHITQVALEVAATTAEYVPIWQALQLAINSA